MKLVLTAFFMAWGMFWMIPCPVKWWDERARVGMLLFLPMIGAMIGLVWALCVYVAERFIPGKIAAALLAVTPYILSGFIHLDGYMDCADAVLSRRDLETRRKILKDSHIGSFAAVALVTLFLTEYSVFAGYSLGRKVWMLPLVCAAPRALCTVAVLCFKPLPGSSYEPHFSGWLEAIKAGDPKMTVTNALGGHLSTAMCSLGQMCMELGRGKASYSLNWDPAKESTGNAAADAMMKPFARDKFDLRVNLKEYGLDFDEVMKG